MICSKKTIIYNLKDKHWFLKIKMIYSLHFSGLVPSKKSEKKLKSCLWIIKFDKLS